MKEKAKIRFNHLFEFDKGVKRKLFKKAINRREQRLKGRGTSTSFPERTERNKEKVKQQIEESKATIKECESEISIIASEIERLQEQKKSLSNVIKYMEAKKVNS